MLQTQGVRSPFSAGSLTSSVGLSSCTDPIEVFVGDFDSTIENEVAHRPWRLPDRPWVMTQTWHDLLFAHWRVDPASLVPLIPPAFELDLFDGDAWLGVVPFHMTNVAPRGVPALPWLSAFPELNVRTYVRVVDKPGIYFFSLDAARSPAVLAARTMLNLPYFLASMEVVSNARIHYESRRQTLKEPRPEFLATYGPLGAIFEAREGTLDHFLTERYCLYALNRLGRPYRLEIHHPPWQLQNAAAQVARNTMAPEGLTLSSAPHLLHLSKRQDMIAWAPESVS